MDPLFPQLPESVTTLSDEELQTLLDEHLSAAELIDADDEEFLKGMDANEIIAQYRAGAEQIKTLRAEQAERAKAHENYVAEKEAIKAEFTETEGDGDDGGEGDGETEPPVEVVAEEEGDGDEGDGEGAAEEAKEKVPVLASGETEPEATTVVPRFARRPPAPSAERQPREEPVAEIGTSLVASAQWKLNHPDPLTPDSLRDLVRDVITDLGPANKTDERGTYRTRSDAPGMVDVFADGKRVERQARHEVIWDGPKTKVAHAQYEFPKERELTGGEDDLDKILNIMPPNVSVAGRRGRLQGEALVASGGLCAPLTPIYTMPNFATDVEPVWESLPIFRASRGGVNVPAATDIGDITTAISSISEEEDALGGTFATKSCQDLTCPEYTEVAVQILAHCREYGNLNARAWPEKIAHENALTMAALSRTTETFMLDRIKALSINLTQAQVLGTYGDLVHALMKARSAITNVLRMPHGARFNVVIPEWIAEMMAADTAYTQFDRFQAQAAMVGHLESLGFRVVLYKDPVTGGTSQAFADAAAGALAEFPDDVQYAVYPEGQFIGIDSGVLELGIVRDSTLNATNDFQVFGERFRNLAMLGPAQGAYWITQGVCPSGEFPALGTALAC